MLSGLPKLLDKQFVIGFLVPVIVFVLALQAIAQPLGSTSDLASAMWKEKDLGVFAISIAGFWLAAVLLMLTNRLVHRSFSGYWWPLTNWWGKRSLLRKWQILADRINAGAEDLRDVSDDPRDPRAEALRDHNQRLFEFRRTFPRDPGQVLGTRFGNAIRVTDRYANRVYGVDGVIIWPRLSGVIPKDFTVLIGDIRSQVDCFINLSLLALIVMGTSATLEAVALWHSKFLLAPGIWHLALGFVGGLFFAKLFYELAIERAVALGELTRAAYDLYLPKLIEALSYKLPPTRADQSALLAGLAATFLYFKPSDRAWDAKPAPPAKPALEEAEPGDDDS